MKKPVTKKTRKPPKRREFVSAEQWQRRIKVWQSMPASERRELDYRLAIGLTEDRMQAMAVIREVFGPGEAGWRACQDAGGCSWWTYRNWADETKDIQPHARSLKQTSVACGRWKGFFGD